MPLTLLKLMARADDCDLDCRVTYSASGTGEINVLINNKYGGSTVLSLTSSYQSVRNVECDIEFEEEEVARKRALEDRRQAARAKLTDEDLEALGLR